MRFMTMVKSAATAPAGPPPMALMEGIADLGIEAGKAGVLVEQGGLLPMAMGATVRLEDGEVRVIDGPFSEAREVVGGYAVYAVDSKEEAIEWTRKFIDLHKQHWPGWEGEVEIRQLMEQPGR